MEWVDDGRLPGSRDIKKTGNERYAIEAKKVIDDSDDIGDIIAIVDSEMNIWTAVKTRNYGLCHMNSRLYEYKTMLVSILINLMHCILTKYPRK